MERQPLVRPGVGIAPAGSASRGKAAEGSRTPRPVGNTHGSRYARSVLECGCLLCTLHASPPLEPVGPCAANSPSPRPSPQGEGGSSPVGRRIVWPGNVRGSGDASPSPRGEGQGEGERAVRHTSASEMKDPCKVQRGQPHSKTLRAFRESHAPPTSLGVRLPSLHLTRIFHFEC